VILTSLRDVAVREGLVQNLDYEPKPVSWLIQLDANGKYLGLVSTLTEYGPKKRLVPKVMNIPRRSGRTSGRVADFLVDKSEYVLGIEPVKQKTRKPQELIKRRILFSEEIRKAAHEVNCAELTAVALFLQSDSELARCGRDLAGNEYASNDLFAFEVHGCLVHEILAVQSYFSCLRQAQNNDAVRQCLVCGEFRPTVDKHPGIRLRGGTTSGVALVSFNSDAFESYGWSRNENAPVCRACADGYSTALTRLLSDRYPDPKHPGSVLGRRALSLSNDTTAVYWADEETETLDLIGGLFDIADPNAVRDLLISPHKGRVSGGSVNPFYCVILSGSQGRAVLRSVHRGSLQEVEENIRVYFRRLLSFVESPMPLFLLLRSMAVQGKAENLAPNLASDIFQAILFGRTLPRTLLLSALQRCRAEQMVTRERAALLGLYVIRNLGKEGIDMGLNRELADRGYRLGRLLAVLDRLQSSAIKANTTLVERYYGAASTRPGTVFPSLLKLAQHHAAKAQSGGYFHAQLGEVLDGVASFPPTLSADEQGMFALGYYHQRQEYFRRKDSAPIVGIAGEKSEEEKGESAR
jgi:CRISPR-associated protein Csd1